MLEALRQQINEVLNQLVYTTQNIRTIAIENGKIRKVNAHLFQLLNKKKSN